MTRASGMNSRALWRNVRGIQTAPFSAWNPDGAVLGDSEGSADDGDVGAGQAAGVFQFVGVEGGAGSGFGQVGGYPPGIGVCPADNLGYCVGLLRIGGAGCRKGCGGPDFSPGFESAVRIWGV